MPLHVVSVWRLGWCRVDSTRKDVVRESNVDIERLQDILDQSYQASGGHLRTIITPERRLTALDLVERLPGMRLLVLATVTPQGVPLTSAVDGIFYRGEFWFGSAPDSLKLRQIAETAEVSVTHLPGEELSVTVHGTAHLVDLEDPIHAGFRDVAVEIYGESWNDWGDGARYARIAPRRMFTFWLPKDD